ncbi:MAG TPA: short-chain dehydrogenase/reductase [Cytophagales bacterium]|jgi:NADP-dependent 3-hydroxy acid dehydrogenase YdfG|nr:short-chain dehydrogenase/reductase [Cytophagales bacterium]
MTKVVLITGTSSGIGKATAEYLGRKGYKVYGGSRSGKENEWFTALKLDVTDQASIDEAISIITKEESRIDVLINNAGIGLAGPIERNKPEDVRKIFETNIIGVMQMCSAVMPVMRKLGGGKIINVSSIGSAMGLPYRGVYSGSKAALDIITEALRVEADPQNIKVALVHPGDVKTEINDHRLISAMEDDDVYGEAFQHAHQTMNEHVSHGIPAESFGPLMERIIKSGKPKIHYYNGFFIQKLSVRLKRYLPTLWFEKMIKRYYQV